MKEFVPCICNKCVHFWKTVLVGDLDHQQFTLSDVVILNSVPMSCQICWNFTRVEMREDKK